jgi:alpha,alpha-trehalase
MNPETRYDPGTGLNHHWDALDLPRPERHSFDREEELGKSYRDVRAAAESGLDFTMIFQGEATHIAGVLLNSLLYKTEKDLEWMAGILGLYPEEARFRAAADKRKKAMNQYLWDSKRGRFENYHLKDQKRIALLSADVFIPLFVKMASKDQATQVRKTLAILEKGGGIMASELMNSPGQWDGSNGWAPYQIFVMEGLRNYGFNDDAQRIAGKWVGMISKVYRKHRKIYERLDVIREDRPASDHAKYPPQEGFLWTNASFVWAMKEILRIPFNVF